MVEEIVPSRPVSVPQDLTKPNTQYRRKVWLALLSLLAFVALYLALTGWFIYTSYRTLYGAFSGGKGALGGIAVGAPMAFLSIFMLKALFFSERSKEGKDFEVKREQEPKLFAFLHRIADEAGAPRPHRVFLSPRVNASVFYDLSILNLLLPSRKNLDIGLGLINTLSLGEVRAVLAHEFGHFGQRAMAVGRWVYVAQRIASHLVHKRDALDNLLRVLSGIDIRVAWIGWGMRIIVWALRSVLDTVFSVVVLAERALSREMEMQADLVAVSLTGSDALIHALHKLGAADAAWDQAIGLSAGRYRRGQAVSDVFALQSRVLERARGVLADDHHGAAPRLPESGRDQHRIFEQRLAHPPRMWSSHPPNREREDNAKRVYVPCELDDRPAWLLFQDPESTRRLMTEFLFGLFESEASQKGKASAMTPEESLRVVDDTFDHIYLDPRYRGAYLGRSAVRSAKTPSDLYVPPGHTGELSLSDLYPEQLRKALERWKSLESERDMLLGLERGLLEAGGGSVQFRGELLRRRDIPKALEKVKAECREALGTLDRFDRQHRSVHLAAAERLGRGWPEYLRSLAALLHYADHTEANIRDARGALANVVAVVTADGSVSSSERSRLAAAGTDVHWALQQAFDQRLQVDLPDEIAEALGVERWAEALPDGFGLGMPQADHIGDWMSVIDSWLDGFIQPLDALERRALEALLKAEAQVAAFSLDPSTLTGPPEPAKVPAQYATLLPGQERERQWRLSWWDRFQIADGFAPSAARFCVAGGLVAFLVGASTWVGGSSVVAHNGLATSVVVTIGGHREELLPFKTSRPFDITKDRLTVRTETDDGELIEAFEVDPSADFTQFVYNVAGAAPIVRWTAVYGDAREVPNENLGTERWIPAHADVWFEDPPKQVSTKGGGARRTVLSSAADAMPGYALSLVDSPKARAQLTRARALWDDADHEHTDEWLHRAADLPDSRAIVERRLARNPREVTALRAEQDRDGGDQHAVCTRHQAMSDAAPEDADLKYVALRCLPDGEDRDRAVLAAFEAARGNPWLAYAAGYTHARHAEWDAALQSWSVARHFEGIPGNVTLDSARVLRLGGSAASEQLSRLAESSALVQHELRLESGDGVEGPALAYSQLARGAIAQALRSASSEPEVSARVLRLAAASKGAPPDVVADALALPEGAGIDGDTIWPSIGLSLRSGRDVTAWLARLKEFTSDEDELEAARRFHNPKELLADPAAADRVATHLNPTTRGHAYAMACVILGDDAPEPWRVAVRALLFAEERPFL